MQRKKRIQLWLMLLLCSGGVVLSAQHYTTLQTTNKKASKFFQRAVAAEKKDKIGQAIDLYQQTIRHDSLLIDSYIKLGDIHVGQNNYPAAISMYETVYQLDSHYLDRLPYALGYMHYQLEHFEQAVPYLQLALAFAKKPNRKAAAQNLLERATFAAKALKNPVPFTPHQLPPTINSPESEYLPSFTANGRQLVYTARRNGQEDLYMAEKKDGQWLAGQPLVSLNTHRNEGAQTMTADGRMLVFTGCDRRDGLGGCDLYISYKKADYWSRPVNMGRQINSVHWDAQPSLSANGNYLFFASTRQAGRKSDIFVSTNLGNGRWSEPANLGTVINTPGDEMGPFFHPDGRNLYFVSDGHPGIGQTDLFRSTLLGDGQWSTPMNLGYPINSTGKESTLIVSLDGRTGYFASTRDKSASQQTDIYSFELYEAARPLPVTYLEATVVDAQTRAPLVAHIELYNPDNEAILYVTQTDQQGQMLTSLAGGRRYGLTVEKENYLFHSESFDLSATGSIDEPFQLYIELQPIRPLGLQEKDQSPPQPVILRNVFFASGSAELLPASDQELRKLYQLLANNPSLKILIEGHTDDVGQEEDNLLLSENRARSVYDFLIAKGINPERLSYQGFGETRPIDTNETPEGRQNNRRTAFLVVE